MKKIIIGTIRLYQKIISPDSGLLRRIGFFKGGVCVFYPTCSEYAISAVEKYGVIRGVWMGVLRVVRCHPWQKKRIDILK